MRNANAHDRCEWCLSPGPTEEHHIAQGKDRKAALNNRACIIWLCRACHQTIQGIRDSRMIGLAILMVRRPDDFSMSEFWRVTDRKWPDRRDVNLWRRRLSLAPISPVAE